MSALVQKQMAHVASQGGMSSMQLGGYRTEFSGLGGARFAPVHRLHVRAGMSLPSGSNSQSDCVRAPGGPTDL